MLEDVRNPSITKEKAILVGIYGHETPRWLAKEYLEELELLADTAGADTVEKILQNRPHPDPSTYVGKGKLNQLKALVGENGSDVLIFDDDLTATQVRNIEKTANVKVLDRSGLILDIFASRAKTSAAKTQVELAQLQYLLPRLTRFWTHLSRQKGGIGTKGPGETQIETDRRLIGDRISTLKDKLEKLDKQRTTQRKGRSGNPRVALVGYTNAGKSTLMNALTDTTVLAEDRLFATLDSTVRRLELENHDVLLSDTVGFIRKLPHNLIESFKSTLDEVRESDVLLHVVDASSRLIDDYIDVVNSTLEELDVTGFKKVIVFNKIDKVEPARLMELKKGFPGAIFVSAERAIGLDKMQQQIQLLIEEDYEPFAYTVPMAHYKAVAFLHDVAVVDSEHFEGNSVTIEGRITQADRNRFESMLDELETAVL
ncbi:MAG: GTPase HflX [Bacteroidetes bacterium]|nr:GTPase HflX [Bacteroidota bacterium]